MNDATQEAQKQQAHINRTLRDMAAKAETCGQTQGGILGGYAVDTEYRPTLRDRLKRTIDDAGSQQRRARNANELFDLLNRNPEVARILELIEEVGR